VNDIGGSVGMGIVAEVHRGCAAPHSRMGAAP